MSLPFIEEATIYVKIQCVSCQRRIERREVLPGEATRTGNTTQQASYWLKQMILEAQNEASGRGWVMFKGSRGEGAHCAHCHAVERDPLGK